MTNKPFGFALQHLMERDQKKWDGRSLEQLE